MIIKILKPLLIPMAIFPLHFLGHGNGFYIDATDAALMADVSDLLVVPIWSAIICSKMSNLNILSAIMYCLVTICVVLTSSLIHYIGWGISSGRIFLPDHETVVIVKDIAMFGTLITTVVYIICLLKHYHANRKKINCNISPA